MNECNLCNGTGMGQYESEVCPDCGGSGEVMVRYSPDPDERLDI